MRLPRSVGVAVLALSASLATSGCTALLTGGKKSDPKSEWTASGTSAIGTPAATDTETRHVAGAQTGIE